MLLLPETVGNARNAENMFGNAENTFGNAEIIWELGDYEIYTPPSLNSLPDFTPPESKFSTHVAKALLEPDSIDRGSPFALLKLFCSDTESDILQKT